MQELISALFDKWADQPILVIGGGPSVLTDLPKLKIKPACVISANEHGARQTMFPLDLIVNMDQNHCMKKVPMESLLRPLGIPIVNRYSWADFRLPEWCLAGNTGLAAIAVAAALGGNPVIVTGIDFWIGSRRYFYSADIKQPRRTHHPSMLRRANKRRVGDLLEACRGANILPMSGPLLDFFPAHDPNYTLPATKPTKYRRALTGVKPIIVEAVTRFRMTSLDMVPAGGRVVLTPKEAASAPFGSKCRRLASV